MGVHILNDQPHEMSNFISCLFSMSNFIYVILYSKLGGFVVTSVQLDIRFRPIIYGQYFPIRFWPNFSRILSKRIQNFAKMLKIQQILLFGVEKPSFSFQFYGLLACFQFHSFYSTGANLPQPVCLPISSFIGKTRDRHRPFVDTTTTCSKRCVKAHEVPLRPRVQDIQILFICITATGSLSI